MHICGKSPHRRNATQLKLVMMSVWTTWRLELGVTFVSCVNKRKIPVVELRAPRIRDGGVKSVQGWAANLLHLSIISERISKCKKQMKRAGGVWVDGRGRERESRSMVVRESRKRGRVDLPSNRRSRVT